MNKTWITALIAHLHRNTSTWQSRNLKLEKLPDKFQLSLKALCDKLFLHAHSPICTSKHLRGRFFACSTQPFHFQWASTFASLISILRPSLDHTNRKFLHKTAPSLRTLFTLSQSANFICVSRRRQGRGVWRCWKCAARLNSHSSTSRRRKDAARSH